MREEVNETFSAGDVRDRVSDQARQLADAELTRTWSGRERDVLCNGYIQDEPKKSHGNERYRKRRNGAHMEPPLYTIEGEEVYLPKRKDSQTKFTSEERRRRYRTAVDIQG